MNTNEIQLESNFGTINNLIAEYWVFGYYTKWKFLCWIIKFFLNSDSERC